MMNFTAKLQLTLGFLLLFSGCSSALRVELPRAEEVLLPQISDNGTKFFLFQRNYLQATPDASDALIGRSGPRSATEDSRGSRMYDRAVEMRVDNALLVTGYCRQGYFELFRDDNRNGFSLRGECREAASDEDKTRFSNESIPIVNP